MLSQQQADDYRNHGYLALERWVDDTWLNRLSNVSDYHVERSKELSASGKGLDLEPDHTAECPRLRRLTSPVDHDDTFREFALEGPAAALAQAILGGPVRFHHSKLNYKWSDGGDEVKWHQDIQFWPHTNYQVLTLGVYLDDVTDDMSPMAVIPNSHNGPLYDLYDDSGKWTGALKDEDIDALDVASAVYLGGPAGSITAHNCRCVHGSAPNRAPKPRPLLLCAYSAAHAIPITNLTAKGKYAEAIVRGKRAKWAQFDPRPVQMPPDWSKTGYKSIFEHQQGNG